MFSLIMYILCILCKRVFNTHTNKENNDVKTGNDLYTGGDYFLALRTQKLGKSFLCKGFILKVFGPYFTLCSCNILLIFSLPIELHSSQVQVIHYGI